MRIENRNVSKSTNLPKTRKQIKGQKATFDLQHSEENSSHGDRRRLPLKEMCTGYVQYFSIKHRLVKYCNTKCTWGNDVDFDRFPFFYKITHIVLKLSHDLKWGVFQRNNNTSRIYITLKVAVFERRKHWKWYTILNFRSIINCNCFP